MSWEIVASVGMGLLSWNASKNAAQAQNDYMEAQHDLNVKKWVHDIKQGKDAWTFADEGVDIQINNDKIIRDHQHATRIDEWVDRDKMRIFDWNSEMKAHNASIERFDKQIDYNSKAEQIALNDTTRKYNETLTKIGFQNEDLQMNLNFESRNMLHQIQGRRSELNRKAQATRIQSLQQEGQVRAGGQVGRSARKNVQAINADTGRLQSAIVDALTRDESLYGFNLDKVHKTFNFSQRQLQESLKSAKGQFSADRDHISLKRWEADMAAEDAIIPMPELPPALSKPRKIPEPTYQRPKHPWGEIDPVTGKRPYLDKIMDMKPVKGAKADTTFGPLISGINTGLSIAGLAKGAELF